MRHRLSRTLHAVMLGLMVLLAGVSNCLCESYDPDPWDETPPVFVDFDYVLPHAVNLDRTSRHTVGTSCDLAAVNTTCPQRAPKQQSYLSLVAGTKRSFQSLALQLRR
jgi:hypothetical protein